MTYIHHVCHLILQVIYVLNLYSFHHSLQLLVGRFQC
uniref:Uncharacterized protein n=1 Tax=Rhizophora mucronata TaxID=61149 RepID=A0A2P2Q7Y0_RHIMU